MASIAIYDNNLIDLPDEIIEMILNKLNDDDLIMQLNVPEFSPFVFELIKNRLDNLSIRNLLQLYNVENFKDEIIQHFNQLSSLKYKLMKDIYQNESEQSIKNIIEMLIADWFANIVGQVFPQGMNIIKQIDTIRAVLITYHFMDIVEENGGPFTAFNGPTERKITNMVVNMVNVGNNMQGHSYSLNITIGLSQNKFRISRGDMVEGDEEYEFNNIFFRLYDSINANYSFNDMYINTQTIGNNTFGPVNKEFNV
jgi:hypothetical protein